MGRLQRKKTSGTKKKKKKKAGSAAPGNRQIAIDVHGKANVSAEAASQVTPVTKPAIAKKKSSVASVAASGA